MGKYNTNLKKKSYVKARITENDESELQYNPGITVITSTIRPGFMENVFENYNRQNYMKKELIIILNNNSI